MDIKTREIEEMMANASVSHPYDLELFGKALDAAGHHECAAFLRRIVWAWEADVSEAIDNALTNAEY